MARERRIEYPDAVYHAMARGDRREDIVLDDEDRHRFVDTLEEGVGRSGWLLFAWVLMNNHYHLLFKTPEANLVNGMTWFQSTWTRRFNTRHRAWGHLFGGRYKAKPVEEGDYLTRLVHYIHLNPVRAGLASRSKGIEEYPWSSLPDYLKPPGRRLPWVAVKPGLQHMGLPDSVAGRRRFLESTEGIISWQHPERAGDAMPDSQSLQSTFRRGWYFGSEAFRDRLLKMLCKDPDLSKERQMGFQGAQTRDHGIAEANRIIAVAERVLNISEDAWATLKKGDWRKGLVAFLIRERSLVANGWLCERLHMGAPNAVSRTISQCRNQLKTDPTARQMDMRIRENVNML